VLTEHQGVHGAAAAARRPAGFPLYFTARTVSLLGDAMLLVALTVAVLDAGYGPSGVGYALAAWLAPVALLVLFGGALADRFEPRRVMVIADLARVVTQSALALAFTAGVPPFWLILALQAACGAATAMFTPGDATMVRRLAADVQRGNAALRIAEALTVLLGPALGGLLLVGLGTSVVFGADAASYALSALCLGLIRLPARERDTPQTPAKAPPMWRALAEGWREFRSRTWLWSVIVFWALHGLLVFGPALPLTAVAIVAAHGTGAYAAVISAFGAGSLVGSVLALRLRPARPLAAGSLAMGAFAIAPLAVATEQPVAILIAAHLVAGASFALWGVLWATTLQTAVPQAVLSRVAAYDVAGSVLPLPLGRALAGPAAAAFGLRPLLAACAVSAVVIPAAMLATPAIRRVRRFDAAGSAPS
jgi:predicted MFS family arabinose efflux permease